jgi:hypothetical protein
MRSQEQLQPQAEAQSPDEPPMETAEPMSDMDMGMDQSEFDSYGSCSTSPARASTPPPKRTPPTSSARSSKTA